MNKLIFLWILFPVNGSLDSSAGFLILLYLFLFLPIKICLWILVPVLVVLRSLEAHIFGLIVIMHFSSFYCFNRPTTQSYTLDGSLLSQFLIDLFISLNVAVLDNFVLSHSFKLQVIPLRHKKLILPILFTLFQSHVREILLLRILPVI